jgi:hypothetical protein
MISNERVKWGLLLELSVRNCPSHQLGLIVSSWSLFLRRTFLHTAFSLRQPFVDWTRGCRHDGNDRPCIFETKPLQTQKCPVWVNVVPPVV